MRLGVLDDFQCILREGDGAVAVGFKVDTDVEAKGGVVKVFYTGVGADDGKLEHFFNVVGTGAVGIGGLNNADFELLGNTGTTGEIANERGSQGGNAVTVQEAEDVAIIDEVVDKTVGVTV